MNYRMDRRAYAETFGPTVGDRIRLADTELFIQVERDYTTYGDEVKMLMLVFPTALLFVLDRSFVDAVS